MTGISDYRRDQAWNAGKKAALAGKPRTTNNRQPGTIYADDWCDGWEDGFRERTSTHPDAVSGGGER